MRDWLENVVDAVRWNLSGDHWRWVKKNLWGAVDENPQFLIGVHQIISELRCAETMNWKNPLGRFIDRRLRSIADRCWARGWGILDAQVESVQEEETPATARQAQG